MKVFLLVFFTLYNISYSTAQYTKFIIQLRDKNSTAYSLDNPIQFLSQRAIDRRNRFNIAVDSADLPVTQKYIDTIKNAGKVTVLSTSKWLNQILIETTDQTAVNKILSFSFVKSAKETGFRPLQKNTSDTFKNAPPGVNPSFVKRPTEITGDTYDYGNSYNQVHIHEGEFLHNKGFHGEKMQIAVLDAGFQQYKTITAFDSVRLNGQILGERDFVAFDGSVNEDDAHGMYCLSILSANWPGRMTGTAPKADYWLIRTENAATEYPVEEHNWAAGAEFADSAGADMISSSLGYSQFDDSSFNHTYADFYKNSTQISRAASAAVQKGMLVTSSAGNEGRNNWKYIVFPADADSVCAVGAIDATGSVAGFSSFGYEGKVKPNIVSVGAGTVIAGLNNQPVTGNGTSFSNPNVAGLIACLWQAFPLISNIKILDAVYKSADRFLNPDARYGYGIPNFKTAYRLLKHDENTGLYGNEWLFAAPKLFTDKFDIKFIGQVDGSAKIELLNDAGKVLASQNFLTLKEDVYNYTFDHLANLAKGLYTVKYSDSATTRTIALQKGNIFAKDWLIAVPNPFKDNVTVYLKAPETGKISVRLLDAKGSLIEKITTDVAQSETKAIRFNTVQKLPNGIYFIQYISNAQRRTIKLIRN